MATNKTTMIDNSDFKASAGSASTIDAIPNQQDNVQRAHNVLLIWLDSQIDENSSDCQNTLAQLRRVVNSAVLFNDSDECLEHIEQNSNSRVGMIISGSLGQEVVPQIHQMSQIEFIFIFCGNKAYHEQWAKEWPKIKGVFTNISLICEALKRASTNYEQEDIPISFVATDDTASNARSNQLDVAFMYTEVMKKIFLTIPFNQQHRQQFIEYCRIQFKDNTTDLKTIKNLEITYANRTPLWWYVNEPFLFSMLNTVLLTMDGDAIIKMGFFINDLHRQIEQVHLQQRSKYLAGKTFTVYRGQRLPKAKFEELMKTKGGLISFNNFLSTSKKPTMSIELANKALSNSDSVGVLFSMTIDPTRSTKTFVAVTELGFSTALEDEILFSMHSLFRINSIQQSKEHARLFQVNLTLINNDDADLAKLTARIQQDTFPEEAGWFRIGSVLLQMGQPKNAEDLFEGLLRQPADENMKGAIYRFLGSIKDYQGKREEALERYKKSIDIFTRTVSPNNLELAKSYGGAGGVYYGMGDYPKALSFYTKTLVIQQKSLPGSHLVLAKSYNNLGTVYEKMLDSRKAQANYERAVAIGKELLPPNHPDLQQWTRNFDQLKKKPAASVFISSE